MIEERVANDVPVIGIFEASIKTAIYEIGQSWAAGRVSTYGIICVDNNWTENLRNEALEMKVEAKHPVEFTGVASIGLTNANE